MSDTAYLADWRRNSDQSPHGHLNDAAKVAASWAVVLRPKTKSAFALHASAMRTKLADFEKFTGKMSSSALQPERDADELQVAILEVRTNSRLIVTAITAILNRWEEIDQLPRVVLSGGEDEPRIAVAMREYARVVDGRFSEESLITFVRALQRNDPFTLGELWNLGAFLKYALAESLLSDVSALPPTNDAASWAPLAVRVRSLRGLNRVDWKFLVEPLIAFEEVLHQDPAGAYEQMDFESRELYRSRIARAAQRSDCSEFQVAQVALELAKEASQKVFGDQRVRNRLTHVGYYLVDRGFSQLAKRIGHHPPVSWRLRRLVLDHPEDFYVTGTLLVALFLISAVLFPVLPKVSSFSALALSLVILVFPAMQIAVDLVNNFATSLFDPSPLPKLDFSNGIPPSCTTLVAVPSLLLNEKQVHELVHELEVRYVANRDPHLHFALVTDLPDSVSRPLESDSHPHVELAVKLINELNARYRSKKSGAVIILHRHRIFNTRQGVWMGWERKRGKLLDLNKLLLGLFDAFPIKGGGYDALDGVRYVITLDSDTQLPRGTAQKMVGAIAHPLNQAVIDSESRIVVEGYGILQPRIGMTVSSTARSRFASIFSGQNGFDIYTHATSDVYQDLFGEGIFTGKGIYEVAILHTVLDRRFPRNALLSHDLIEGAYARAGLVSDIELVDDYPSHYSAYSRRQHRWVRGDWQIAQWIFPRVPDESGKLVPNPITDISRWKIFDNLRRSLVEPFLLLLFVAGWLGLPGGPAYWTLIPLLLLFFPAMVQCIAGVCRALVNLQFKWPGEVFSNSATSARLAFLHLVFLGQQTLVIFDAVIRSLVRSFVTGERLLEWETAAQAESQMTGRRGIDRYLVFAPFLSIGLAVLIWAFAAHKYAIMYAAPILVLWAIASPVSVWLDQPMRKRQKIRDVDVDFLLIHAFRIWRYFREFAVGRHNFLVPDNVEEDTLKEAARISPTNIGLLLNARQAACEFGFVTIPEFADNTCKTMSTIDLLETYRGHLYNWYDTGTLRVLRGLDGSAFISTVDSGNLAASLFTLHSGVRSLLTKPLVDSRLFVGIGTCWSLVRSECTLSSSAKQLRMPKASAHLREWLAWLPVARETLEELAKASTDPPEKMWWIKETLHRIDELFAVIRDYMPWALPEFEALLKGWRLADSEAAIDSTLDGIQNLAVSLDSYLLGVQENGNDSSESRESRCRMLLMLNAAKLNTQTLSERLIQISNHARKLAEETDFSFLVDRNSDILSIGYDADSKRLIESHYDLLASEARVAVFLAVSAGDLPQESWFKLSRDHAFAFGEYVLTSWTGTMFEYLMPALWMRSYPYTLIMQSLEAVVRVQRRFARSLGLPWGISESGHSPRNEDGAYGYRAFGVPAVAVSSEATAGPVISPYSTFLALNIDPKKALENLRRLGTCGWSGQYGYYEAIDFQKTSRGAEVIREWMVHHQGMSLLAILNLLCDNRVQTWFHDNAVVQSVERLLHESSIRRSVLELPSSRNMVSNSAVKNQWI